MDKRILERLEYYGFISCRMGDKQKAAINEMIISYVTTNSAKIAKSEFNNLAYFASFYHCTFKADLLIATRERIQGVTKKSKSKKSFDILPIDKDKPVKKREHSTIHKSQKIASSYQERKKNLPIPKNQANDLDYHYCLHCGERATNQKELNRFFSRENINGVMCYDIVCKGCKDEK